MKYFTPEELYPSDTTIKIIKQLAHTYRVIKTNQQQDVVYCLN